MIRKILFKVQDTQATYLQPEDGTLLQGLLENCADYFELVHGCPPAESEAQALFEAKPPTKNLKDKIVIGLWNPDQKLIGVLDAMRDYPSQNEWFLGLLLIDPAYRQQGLGRKAYQAFEKWITRKGAQQIGLGVVEQNQRAYDFWQSLGFEVAEKRPPKRYGNRDNVVIVMKRLLHKA